MKVRSDVCDLIYLLESQLSAISGWRLAKQQG
jgi:hypothetical protein